MMVKHMVGVVAALALAVICPSAAAQNYKQTHKQIFCNIVGEFAAQAAADYYSRTSLEQALQRTDSFICTDQIDKVCAVKVSMLQGIIRNMYDFGQQRQTQNLSSADFWRLDDAVKVQATSACWQAAQQH